MFSPEFLAGTERFETWIREQDTVVAITSILDQLRILIQAMNGGAPDALRIAPRQEANAQLMVFYELSLPVGMDLNTMMDVDRTQTRLVVGLRVEHSEDIRVLAMIHGTILPGAPGSWYWRQSTISTTGRRHNRSQFWRTMFSLA